VEFKTGPDSGRPSRFTGSNADGAGDLHRTSGPRIRSGNPTQLAAPTTTRARLRAESSVAAADTRTHETPLNQGEYFTEDSGRETTGRQNGRRRVIPRNWEPVWLDATTALLSSLHAPHGKRGEGKHGRRWVATRGSGSTSRAAGAGPPGGIRSPVGRSPPTAPGERGVAGFRVGAGVAPPLLQEPRTCRCPANGCRVTGSRRVLTGWTTPTRVGSG